MEVGRRRFSHDRAYLECQWSREVHARISMRLPANCFQCPRLDAMARSFAVWPAVLIILSVTTSGAAPQPGETAVLSRYAGTWQITRQNAAADAKPDVLSNECATVGRYFACQQTTSGRPGGLLVFIPTSEPGHFYTQTILPEGRATGRDDLRVNGDEWTYSSRRDQNGQTTLYRNVNRFTGRNRIHYEQAQSTNGTDWTVQSSGDEVRLGPSGKPLH